MKKNMPKFRLIANLILTIFINILLRNNATEYFSGFRGFRVDKLNKIKLTNFSNGWVIEQQVHFEFILKKYNITEIPILTVYKKNQISNLPPINYVLSVLITLFKFFFLRNFF
jgi:hypothetical protein